MCTEYLDGRPFDNNGLTLHEFGNMDSKTKVTLLYRPGHYDILYEIEWDDDLMNLYFHWWFYEISDASHSHSILHNS